ncbi:hypothetical protein [Pseudomonas fluorescens]
MCFYGRKKLGTSYAKLFYRPIEIAIRWCRLIDLEAKILEEAYQDIASIENFESYPCIQKKLEILWDAIRHQELPYGYFGVTAPTGTPIEPKLLTVRHTDLKIWINRFYPNEKPAFLFSSFESHILRDHNSEIFNELIIEIETRKLQHTRQKEHISNLEVEIENLKIKNSTLIAKIQKAEVPSDRSERAHLRIIGSLLNLLLGKTPSGKKYSSFTSQASIISVILALHPNKPGFTQRTLESKFSAANRSIHDLD